MSFAKTEKKIRPQFFGFLVGNMQAGLLRFTGHIILVTPIKVATMLLKFADDLGALRTGKSITDMHHVKTDISPDTRELSTSLSLFSHLPLKRPLQVLPRP